MQHPLVWDAVRSGKGSMNSPTARLPWGASGPCRSANFIHDQFGCNLTIFCVFTHSEPTPSHLIPPTKRVSHYQKQQTGWLAGASARRCRMLGSCWSTPALPGVRARPQRLPPFWKAITIWPPRKLALSSNLASEG